MKYIAKNLITVIVIMVVLSMPVFTEAATIDQLNQQKKSAQQKATEAKQKAAEKQREAEYLNTQINSIEKQVSETERAIAETTKKTTETQKEIDNLNNQIKEQQDNLVREKDKMNQIIAAWYMEGADNSMSSAILSSNTLSEVVTKQEYYDSINQQIEATIEKIAQLKNELIAKKGEQDIKMRELKRLQETQELQKNGLENQEWVKNRLLKDTTQMIAELKEEEREAAQLEKQVENQISALLASMGSQFGAGTGQKVSKGDVIGYEGSTGYSTGPHVHFMVFLSGNLSNYKNPYDYIGSTLSWPLSNPRVTQGFGMTDYARAGAYGGSPHNGVDITDGLGAPVLASASGTVMLHQYFGGYGNAVVVRHDNDLWTLYGHLMN